MKKIRFHKIIYCLFSLLKFFKEIKKEFNIKQKSYKKLKLEYEKNKLKTFKKVFHLKGKSIFIFLLFKPKLTLILY